MLLLQIEINDTLTPIGVSDNLKDIEQYLLDNFAQVTKVSMNEYHVRRKSNLASVKCLITSLIIL